MASRQTLPLRKPIERRVAQRKAVLFGGVVVDKRGKHLSECTIQNVSAHGAQIALSKNVSVGEQLYLVDTHSQTAHSATVKWTKGDATGVSFDRTYRLSEALPPERKFLGRIFIESKVRQFQGLVLRGLAVETAIGIVGLTKDHFEQHLGPANTEEKDSSVLGQLRQVLTLKHELNA